jgi:hypothetical protein
MWPVGGAWLCQHLWEHYAFSGGDKEILKEIYPLLKGSAEFLSSILVEYPKYGYLVTPISIGWSAAGEVTGLRARGGYTVNMKWEKGRLTFAEISNPDGGVCQIRYNGKVRKITVPKERSYIIMNYEL